MLNEDFKEFAALLNSNRIEYLIVGGYALAACLAKAGLSSVFRPATAVHRIAVIDFETTGLSPAMGAF